ncbi:MAG: bifunctional DNA-formamidopyrimidine glycosylase/DNA-(apurinic or apyrimidinic site) lyase [Rhodocyclales bacterium]|nr:bifunctional DNA-formamidopyrimidine glycosylase/DNA-(apurinic or apyrimidinic site) lyase [Rhodocyclales bacterium]
MPELPEVETTCRGIRPVLTGQRVTGCVVRNPRLRQPVSETLGRTLIGQTLLDVRRRAKYVLLVFAGGNLIVHLGMSGSLRVVGVDEPPAVHDHVDLVFGGQALRLRDPRRFGLMLWHAGEACTHPLLASLGPEPLDEGFDGARLRELMGVTRVPIKQALMDGRRVVGIGNIYASESLFRARIHPLAPASGLGVAQYRRLAQAVRETLMAAIAAGGSTLKDFVGGDGKPGYFQQSYAVYGRDGQACRACGATIRRAVVGQRATFWCPRCQRGGRNKAD